MSEVGVLRITFTDQDLAKVRVASAPDPLWEITNSLDRLQTSQGRPVFRRWLESTRTELSDTGFGRTVREMLIPLLPRATYFPDFLTPTEAHEGLDAGFDAILRTPSARVTDEIGRLAAVRRTPKWAFRVADRDLRTELVATLRAYHNLVIAPHESVIQAEVDRDRAVRGRSMLHGGVEQLLDSFRPLMRWNKPVLEVEYPVSRHIRLAGRGLTLIPSYFCWQAPVALADPELPPVLIYPLLTAAGPLANSPSAASALMGTTRAAVLRATANGMTTSEVAAVVGISAQTASHHLNVLRASRLITSHRMANSVLHAITPLGSALVSPGGGETEPAERGKPQRHHEQQD